MTKTTKTLALVDGYGFVFRAYHSLPPLTSPDGTPVGALYGFTNMLLRIMQKHKCDMLAVILDSGAKTFRNDLYEQYKANRPPPPEDLCPQFPLIRKAALALGVPTIETPGYEADDLIASYCLAAKEKGIKVDIISSDKDLMQLVDEDIAMVDPIKTKKIGINEVKEKFGVFPDKMVDMLALVGDSSDNVPGVPGIGPKTAAELLNNYGSLDNIFSHVDEIKQNKRRETIKNNKDKALLSKKLVTLCRDLELPITIDRLTITKPDSKTLESFLREYGFNSLLARLPAITGAENAALVNSASNNNNKQPEKYEHIHIKNIKQLQNVIASAGEIRQFCIYTKPLTSDDRRQLEYLGFSFGKKEVYGIKLQCKEIDNGNVAVIGTQNSLFDDNANNNRNLDDAPNFLPAEKVLEILKPILIDNSITKISHDVKWLLKYLHKKGFSIALSVGGLNFEDIMVMSYVAYGNSRKHDIIQMHKDNAIEVDETIIEFISDKKNKKKNGLEEIVQNSTEAICTITGAMYYMYNLLRQELFKHHLLYVYYKLDKPLLNVLAQMENYGIKLDIALLASMSSDFDKRIKQLQQQIYDISGEEFNVGSPKQLGEILFSKMGLPAPKKSKKSGYYTTNYEILEELAASGYEIAQKILDWRQLSKLKNTYVDTLPRQVDEHNRVHTTFLSAVTSTGRLSSIDPNLQNIPIRTEEGAKIRQAFIADKGNVLLSADYSQIELRLLADIADIQHLKDALKEGKDIHAFTASQVFGVDIDKVDVELRRKAKMINFGIIYGISAFGLAHRLGIARSEAAACIKAYFKQYPGIEGYMEKTKEYARQHGFVKTLYGRKCFLSDISSKNPALRQFSERAAINAPLQGTASDIIKKAMIEISYALSDSNIKAKMLLQVHDELVFEVAQKDQEALTSLVKKHMENAAFLSVPLIVDINYSNNWQK